MTQGTYDAYHGRPVFTAPLALLATGPGCKGHGRLAVRCQPPVPFRAQRAQPRPAPGHRKP